MKKTARCIVIVIKFQLSNSDLVIVLCFSIKFTFHVCLCSTVVKASLCLNNLYLFRRNRLSWRCHWEMLLFIAWTI